jgi:glycosyltransferase involved in cell wall biosynthesis
MKIVYIASSIIPSRTANSVHVMKMCQALANNGHEVELLIPDKIEKDIKTENIYDFYDVKKCFRISRITFLRSKVGFFIFTFLAVLKAKKKKPDLVYTRFLYSAFISLLFGLPTVYEIHASFEKRIEKIFFYMMNKNKLKKIVVISNSLRDHFIGKYQINKKRIFVAPDGADPVKNSFVLEKKDNKETSEISVGYFGNLYKGRGIDVIAEMAKRCPWAQFYIIGGFPKDIDYWKHHLSDLKNITFYGYVPHKEVNKYMVSCDVLIAPYQKEVTIQGLGNTCQWMSPLKIFEYMAMGKSILSSDLPALREVLKHRKNSLLALPEDIDGWVSNLKLVRDDLILRDELGKNAKKDFEDNYTWESRAHNILKSLGRKEDKNIN